MVSLDKRALIDRARLEHACGPGVTAEQIAAFEVRLGCQLPGDLRELLVEINGANFWANGNFPCRLLSIDEIVPVQALLGTTDGPASLLAIVDFSGDYVAVDVQPGSSSFGRLIDCFHETFPFELHGVCDSVWELLDLVLTSAGEEWLWPAALRYGVDYATGRASGA